MTLGTKDTKANAVDEYNSDTLKATNRALHYGSLVRPRATLAELAGLAANDNNRRLGE